MTILRPAAAFFAACGDFRYEFVPVYHLPLFYVRLCWVFTRTFSYDVGWIGGLSVCYAVLSPMRDKPPLYASYRRRAHLILVPARASGWR